MIKRLNTISSRRIVKEQPNRLLGRRTNTLNSVLASRPCRRWTRRPPVTENGGGERDRTDDLVNANHALSQLSYTPMLWSIEVQTDP